jgi:diguanylate cyclase (GGDEF)-like protein/PAS domain S-box-containing protein
MPEFDPNRYLLNLPWSEWAPIELAASLHTAMIEALPDLASRSVPLSLLNALQGRLETLQSGIELWEMVLKLLPDGVLLTELDGIIRYVSPVAADILGFAPENLIGRSIFELIPSEAAEDGRQRIQSIIAGNPLNRGVYQLTNLTGRVTDVEVRGSLIPGNKDRPLLLALYVQDVTRRKTMERRLAESEEQLRNIIATLPDGVTQTDLNGDILFVSSAAIRLHGIDDPQSVIGKSVLNWVAAEDHSRVLEHLKELLRGETVRPEIYTLTRADNSTFHGEIMTATLRDPGAQITGFISITRDQTEREQQARQLQEQEARYRLLAENVVDVIAIIEMSGQISYISPSVERLTGYSVSECLSFHPAQLLGPQSTDAYDRLIAFLGQSANAPIFNLPNSPYLFQLRRKDGGLIWAESTLNGYPGPDGRLAGFIAVIRDVTSRKGAEQAAEEQRLFADALGETAAALNSALGLEDTLDVILENVSRLAPNDLIIVLMVEPNGMARVMRENTHGRPEHSYIAHMPAFKINQTPTLKQMMESHRPVIISDVSEAEWVGNDHNRWVRSYLAAPIIVSASLVGFISLMSATSHLYTPEHAPRLMAFADQAAVAIEKAHLFEKLHQMATTDPLTGLANRRKLIEQAEIEIARALRYHDPLSLILIDLDNFKDINDGHGHLVGDQALREIASILASNLRKMDLIGRFGGDEFVVLLPEIDFSQALQAAERIRQSVQAYSIQLKGTVIHITASLGLAELSSRAASLDALLEQADRAMYAAKASGRNRLAWSGQQPDQGSRA